LPQYWQRKGSDCAQLNELREDQAEAVPLVLVCYDLQA